MLRATGLFLILALMWWLWSGHASPMLLGFGLLSCLLVMVLAMRMGFTDQEAAPLHLGLRAPIYWAWLSKEMLLSSLDCCKRILRPGRHVHCVVAEIKADQPDDLGKVVYANSITLTPGTLTMKLDQDRLTIHALDESLIAALQTGEMSARIRRMG